MKILRLIAAITLFTTSIFTSALLALPTATISGTATVCKDAAYPEIIVTGAGGTAPYTFTYQINGVTQPIEQTSGGNSVSLFFSPLTVGTFTYTLVRVSDALGHGQNQTGSATVTVDAPTVTPTSINVCLDLSMNSATIDLTSYENTVNNTGGNTFAWFSDAGSGNPLVPISDPTNYTIITNYTPTTSIVYVYVTNTVTGCTNSESVNINVGYYSNPPLLQTTVCVGQTVALPNLGTGLILWYFPFSTPNIAEYDFTTIGERVKGLSVGTTYAPYQIVNGFCTYNGSQLITVNPLPTATISGTKTVGRNTTNPEITFTGVVGTGPFTFTYNVDGGAEQTCTGSVFQSTAALGTFVYNLVKVEDINGCSQAQTGSATIIVEPSLSAELNSFTAHPLSKNTQLTWQTASEKNNAHFDIERSTDGKTFSKIGQTKGHGTTSQVQKYGYLDTNPFSGVNYYRLKQVDVDGQFTYSKTVSVEMSNAGKNISVYPNPVKDKVMVETTIQGDYTVELFDITGKLLQSYKANQPTMQLTINDLPNGVYMISVKSNAIQQTFKVIKQ
jgi:Secretion system C-terminal sorting domain